MKQSVLFGVFTVVWGLLFVYTAAIRRRQDKLEKSLDQVREQMGNHS